MSREKWSQRQFRERSPDAKLVSCDLRECIKSPTIYFKSYRFPWISQYRVPFGPRDRRGRSGSDNLATYLIGLPCAKWTILFLNPDPERFHCKRVRVCHTDLSAIEIRAQSCEADRNFPGRNSIHWIDTPWWEFRENRYTKMLKLQFNWNWIKLLMIKKVAYFWQFSFLTN